MKTSKEIWDEINTYDNSCKFGDYVLGFIDANILSCSELGDYEDLSDCIYDAMDRGLIYYDDQWELMKNYQTPEEANLSEAEE